MLHNITREIGIDVGHRVPDHGSKCRNLHGHRYTVQATCTGPLFVEGEQTGMVLDFGFLKEEMMHHIDRTCDHGTVLYINDPLARLLMGPQPCIAFNEHRRDSPMYVRDLKIDEAIETIGVEKTKLYFVGFVPTAENLAAHWFRLLHGAVEKRTQGKARLLNVRVWETPNCQAVYPA